MKTTKSKDSTIYQVVFLVLIVFGKSTSAQELFGQEAPAQEIISTIDENAVTTNSVPLWQALNVGMTPEEAIPVISSIDGVKRVKLLKPKKSDPTKRLDINYSNGGISVAGIMLDLQPRFAEEKLNQVWLMANDQCSLLSAERYNVLSKALGEKYSELVQGTTEISENTVRSAGLASLRTNSKNRLSVTYGDENIVVFLTFHVWEEQSPAPPSTYTKFGYSLWKLSQSMFESRRSECSGTGDERSDIEIGYLTRSEFNQIKQETLDSRQQAKDAIKDKI